MGLNSAYLTFFAGSGDSYSFSVVNVALFKLLTSHNLINWFIFARM